jgi:hypothetical protein
MHTTNALTKHFDGADCRAEKESREKQLSSYVITRGLYLATGEVEFRLLCNAHFLGQLVYLLGLNAF